MGIDFVQADSQTNGGCTTIILHRRTMNIGILREDSNRERRIALTPAAVQSLIATGNTVYVEKEAGAASHFSDEQYEAVGASIAYTSDEVIGRSELLLKVSSPTKDETSRLVDSQILFSFLHLAIARTQMAEAFLRKGICSIGYELIEDETGNLPILQQMSEIAGQMSIQVAARYLESNNNGRGIVLGGITGVPPATVVIIGAGTVGQAAARIAVGAGAEVIMFDRDLGRLRLMRDRFHNRIVTATINPFNLKKALHIADAVVGAVLIKGERAPHVVSEDMVKHMKPGSIIVDVSIDQGGCVETSRPTTLENPTYVVHNVVHYCVPNMAANVARTATHGLTNALLPYVAEIAGKGIDRALHENAGLVRGVCTFKGRFTNPTIARRFEMEAAETQSLITVQE
jgi:alanine dehydrogenase